MEIYVVIKSDYDWMAPEGIFSTIKKAEEVAAELNKKYRTQDYDVMIYTLNELKD